MHPAQVVAHHVGPEGVELVPGGAEAVGLLGATVGIGPCGGRQRFDPGDARVHDERRSRAPASGPRQAEWIGDLRGAGRGDMPRRSVGRRYVVLARPRATIGANRMAIAEEVPIESRTVITGVPRRPRLWTVTRAWLGSPACTRSGWAARPTARSSRQARSSPATITSATVPNPSSVSSHDSEHSSRATHGEPGDERQPAAAGEADHGGFGEGTGTRSRRSSTAASRVIPRAGRRGSGRTRWARTGPASAFRSSGVTKCRPSAAARARATAWRLSVARGTSRERGRAAERRQPGPPGSRARPGPRTPPGRWRSWQPGRRG